jgi:hypothetical protein
MISMYPLVHHRMPRGRNLIRGRAIFPQATVGAPSSAAPAYCELERARKRASSSAPRFAALST